eukprot:scaffold3451_cov238-Ochromonas_danica.AAC.1
MAEEVQSMSALRATHFATLLLTTISVLQHILGKIAFFVKSVYFRSVARQSLLACVKNRVLNENRVCIERTSFLTAKTKKSIASQAIF